MVRYPKLQALFKQISLTRKTNKAIHLPTGEDSDSCTEAATTGDLLILTGGNQDEVMKSSSVM